MFFCKNVCICSCPVTLLEFNECVMASGHNTLLIQVFTVKALDMGTPHPPVPPQPRAVLTLGSPFEQTW